jgi:hypothetical protein
MSNFRDCKEYCTATLAFLINYQHDLHTHRVDRGSDACEPIAPALAWFSTQVLSSMEKSSQLPTHQLIN